MIKAIFNALSGRTGKWNKLRDQKFTIIETIVTYFHPEFNSSQYFPFVVGADFLLDAFISPHKKEMSIECNPTKITNEMYSELIDIATASLIQIYLNISNDDELTKNAIKKVYLASTNQPGIKFEDLMINQFSKIGEPNIVEISTYMFSEFRRIVNAPPTTLFENYKGLALIAPTYEFVINLKTSNEVDRLIH